MSGLGRWLLVLSFVLLVGSAPAARAAQPSAFPSASFDVSLSATPANGPAPLLVQLAATISAGVPTALNWSFGDGTYLNSSSAAAEDLSHLYERPAQYEVQLTVHEGAEQSSAALAVRVISSELSVAVTASPLSGAPPLTVTFHGTVTGGTGTYVAFNWTFGDGDTGSGSSVEYTYARSGHFYATLSVEDSSGSTASAGVWINLSASSSSSNPGITSAGALGWALVGFAVGLVLALLAFPVRAWIADRRTKEPGAVPPSVPDVAAGEAAPPEATATPMSGEPPRPDLPATSEPLRTSQRVLVHLAGQGAVGPYDVAPPGVTQAGIGAALSVRQNALTNVLRRLSDAGLIETEVRHVRGQPRRLKVYRLTPRGQLLARELRHRRPPRAEE